jgi:hypothetical protein
MLQPARTATLVCALFMEILGSAAVAGTSCSRDAGERYIKVSEAAWAESAVANDGSVVERILSDDFVGVAPNGQIYDKAHAANAPSGFKSNHLEYVNIRFYGDTAVAQGSEKWERTTGRVRVGHFVWIDTWVCRMGDWRVVSAEDVMVLDKK